ncbi:hypothetical protein BV22DRAFT_1051967 [Leucogyrophana mollusca]|uniref:Uncharacterized protein n=1 Tax=Leucogyrophana mollusca TaxID=85980 RepID=A0ACB8AXX2_9AGAM|nr:hypothetical protein BV22DRAFT_1051967 [Leucogyrophana mollusca]
MPTMKPNTALTIAILYKDCAIIRVPAEDAPEAQTQEERRKANEARLTSSRLAGLDQRLFDVPRSGLPESARPSVQALFAALKATKNMNDHMGLLEPKTFKKKGNKDGSHAAGIAAYNDFLKKSGVQRTINTITDKVLTDMGMHPLNLLAERTEEDEDYEADEFPQLKTIEGQVSPSLIAAIFSDAAFLSSGATASVFASAASAFLHHTWERYRKVRRRSGIALDRIKSDCNKAFAVLNDGKKMGAKELRASMEALRKYSVAIQWWPLEKEKSGGVVENETMLRTLLTDAMEAKGMMNHQEDESGPPATPLTKAKQAGRARARKLPKVDFADSEVLSALWATFVTLFETEGETVAPALAYSSNEETGLETWLSSPDMGVEDFHQMNDEQLATLLAFPNNRPALFAEFRSKLGHCAWESKLISDTFVATNPDVTPLGLLWHQMCGIAAIASKVWSDKLAPMPGLLVADDVGVGKTALTMGMIALVISVWITEAQTKVGRPPLLEKLPYFAGGGSVPDLPHLIIVPNGLVNQWYSELRTFFKPNIIDIHIFPTASKDWPAFWEGQWDKSTTPMIHRIILVSHSTLQTQASQVLQGTKGGANKGKAWSEPRKHKQGSATKLGYCLWRPGQNYNVIVCDEAHEFRNIGPAFWALSEVTAVAKLPMMLTATPLWTSPKDITSLFRLIREPSFLGHSGDDMDKEWSLKLQRARRGLTRDEVQQAGRLTLLKLSGQAVSTKDDPLRDMRTISGEWVLHLQGLCRHRIIRRTVNSLRFDGRPINESLPPHKIIIARSALEDDEQLIVDTAMEEVVHGPASGLELEQMNTKFYLPYRLKVAWPFGSSNDYPVFKSMEEWRNSDKGTKLQQLVLILQHHIWDHHLGPLQFNTYGGIRLIGNEATPTTSPVSSPSSSPKQAPLRVGTPPPTFRVEYLEPPPPGRKILVYHEFPMMADLILSVFNLHNISALALNGTMTPKLRSEVVHQFNTDPAVHVLLFSQVGAVGLNLTVADVVILFDQCWSRLLANQIIGRAWRFGQVNTVLVYIMVTLSTIDVMMIDHGHNKGDMLATFLSKPSNLAAAQALSKDAQADNEDDDEDDAQGNDHSDGREGPSKGKAKAKPKAKAAQKSTPAPTPGPGVDSDTDGMDINDPKGKAERKDKGKGNSTAAPKIAKRKRKAVQDAARVEGRNAENSAAAGAREAQSRWDQRQAALRDDQSDSLHDQHTQPTSPQDQSVSPPSASTPAQPLQSEVTIPDSEADVEAQLDPPNPPTSPSPGASFDLATMGSTLPQSLPPVPSPKTGDKRTASLLSPTGSPSSPSSSFSRKKQMVSSRSSAPAAPQQRGR